MYTQKSSKSKNRNSIQRPKKQRPKPEWTTDFVDRSHFKLSEAQMIQKKAALQSKHRQEARLQLQQRRRKLQQGIIDQQTRKIYQTALTSKKIDINPPMRKNLTQMIKYQRQQKQKMNEDLYDDQNGQGYNSDNQQQNDQQQQSIKQIKQAQDFIKKFQKAKKQQKIQRAVQILTNQKHKDNKNTKKSGRNQQINTKNNFIDYMMEDKSSYKYSSRSKPNQSSNFSQDQAISSIEDTIKFMQQKLFAAKKMVDEHSKSFIQDAKDQQQFIRPQNIKQEKNVFKEKKSQQNFKNNKIINNFTYKQQEEDQLQFGQRMAEISQLRIKLKQQNENSSDDQCMDTIRRMRQLMDQKEIQFQTYGNKKNDSFKMKQNIRDNLSPSIQFNSTIQKNSQNFNDSEAQVSFNLTANQDNSFQFQAFPIKSKKSDRLSKQISSKNNWQIKQNNQKKNKQDQYEDEYQKVKQNLFKCLNKNGFDSDDESQDSLLVKSKINMWKNQLQHQADPEQNEQEDIKAKTTNINYNKKFANNESSKNRFIIKQSEQNQEEEYQQQPYKNNFITNNNIKKNNFVQTSSSANFTKKPPMIKKSNQNNQQFDALKNMISNASSQIQKIEIQPLKIEPVNQTGGLLGFDFRGSINLKKNVLSK